MLWEFLECSSLLWETLAASSLTWEVLEDSSLVGDILCGLSFLRCDLLKFSLVWMDLEGLLPLAWELLAVTSTVWVALVGLSLPELVTNRGEWASDGIL